MQLPPIQPDRELTIGDLRFDPPCFSLEEVREHALKLYGLRGEFKPLAGERDQNYRVHTDDGSRFVFKISGISEPADVVDMQVKALCHIEQADPLLAVPRMLRSRDGKLVCHVENEQGRHMVRLLSWLPGIRYRDGAFPSHRGLQGLGAFIARLGKALAGFEHPAASHFMPWNMANGLVFSPQLRTLMHEALADAELSQWFRVYFDHLQYAVYPELSGQRWQVIHQDGHGANLLRSSPEDEAVAGVIDFGDMIYGPLVCDIAACASDFMDISDDPMAVTMNLCVGYHRILPLQDSELDLVLDLMMVRQMMVLQLFEFRRRHMDDPPDFVTDDQPQVIAGLRRMAAIDRRAFSQLLKESVRNG